MGQIQDFEIGKVIRGWGCRWAETIVPEEDEGVEIWKVIKKKKKTI